MPVTLDRDVIEFVRRASVGIGERFEWGRIKALHNGMAVRDSPITYRLPGVFAADDAILRLSNSEFPNFMRREVERIRVAHDVLPDELAEVIPLPVVEGIAAGRTFAIWPKCRHLSSNKIVATIQKRRLHRRVFAWLRGVAEVSVYRDFNRDEIYRECSLPLDWMMTRESLSERTRRLANRAIKRLSTQKWQPIGVLQHSDLWVGNIMLPRFRQLANNKFRFFVIDWGASVVRGAPGMDIIRYCMSVNLNANRARATLLDYARVLQINPANLVCETTVGLGRLGLNLTEFPEERYAALCEAVFDYLAAAGFDAAD